LADLIQKQHLVAVIGAGPAGLYASQYLARHGVQVVLFNRDIKPGGLAEYGIFPEKHKMRLGLKNQFERILQMHGVHYCGNVVVGQSGDIKLDQLRRMGFQAFMVTTGAQQNNWLGLPGEDLEGVYQANDIVFHYNHLPEYADRGFQFGKEIAVIGVGNVMLDIMHYLKLEKKSRHVTAFGRRGPNEVKFDTQTLEPVVNCLDLAAVKAAVDLARVEAHHVGRDVSAFFDLLADAREKAEPCDSELRFTLQFLRSPKRLIGDENGHVKSVVFEINHLAIDGDRVIAQGTGEFMIVPADTVIFSIGSRVNEGFGLPVGRGNFVTAPEPQFPVDGISYEVYNPDLCAECEDIFVSGWARLASEGIVGLAKKDAERGARAVLQYLATLDSVEPDSIENIVQKLPKINKPVVGIEGLKKLWAAEQRMAAEKGLLEYSFNSHQQMLKIIEDQ